MARRDMNQRIVPEAVQDYKIQPVANPVDKMERFSPDVETAKAKQQGDLYNSLAVFGKGTLDTSLMLQRHAEDNAIAAQAKADKNKKDWAEVSKHFDGMAKFNPYNKDAFKKLVSADITREYVNNLYADPDLNSRTPEEVANMVENNQQDMIEAFKQNGLSAKDYSQYLVDYSNRAYALKQQHIKDHAEVEFKFIKNKFSESMGDDIATAIYNGNSISDATLNAEKAMDELGWTNQTKAEVIMDGLKAYVAKNPEASSADIEAFVSTYTIGGSKLTDYIPNGSVEMRNFVKQIKVADFQDQKLEWEIKKFHQKQGIDEAMNNLTSRYLSGELNDPAVFEQAVREQALNYGLDGEATIQLFKGVIDGRITITSLKNTISDPETELQLAMGIIDGSTTREDITAAMAEHKLSADDGYRMIQNMMTSEQKANNETEKYIKRHLTDTTNEYLKDNKQTGVKAKLRSREDKEWLLNQMNDLSEQLRAGKITQEQFNLELSKRKQFILQDAEKRRKGEAVTAMAKGYEDLRATPQISDAQWNKIDVSASKLALRRMKIVRNSIGGVDNTLKIDSAPQKNRTITVTENGKQYTKTSRHTGYDLKSDIGSTIKGRPVYSPMAGEVVGVVRDGENDGGMGNMVLIKCSNGKLIKYMHLQSTGLPRVGTLVTKDTVIGHVGNTGAVGNKEAGSLHVEFYNANHQWITAWQFMS